jgi:hypothetical protein
VADGIILEKLGTKAVVLLTDGFVRNGVATANRLGIPNYQFITVPHPIMNLTEEQCAARAADAFRDVIALLRLDEREAQDYGSD